MKATRSPKIKRAILPLPQPRLGSSPSRVAKIAIPKISALITKKMETLAVFRIVSTDLVAIPLGC